MRTWHEIAQLMNEMVRDRSPILLRMREIQIRYDGDYVIPIPDTDKMPALPQLAPMLISQVVDQTSQRASTVDPILWSPALDPVKERGKRSTEYASIRRRALQATYADSKWQIGRRKSFRQMAAYDTTCIVVVPDFTNYMPRIQVRDPLSAFVEQTSEDELRAPEYGGFVTRHSGADLRWRFPAARHENGGPITNVNTDQQWEMLEWYDSDQVVFGLLGPVHDNGLHISNQWVGNTVGLQISPQYPNRAGCCPIITPSNVALNRQYSRLYRMLGSVDIQSKLTALDIIAQEKAIFPDMYALGRMNGTPTIVGGTWQDGREGNMNLLADVEQVGVLRQTPDQRTGQLIDRLERNFRTSTGLSPMYGGESFGSLRTGRALDSMMGISVDPMIQELHEVHAAWMPHVHNAVFETYKGWWGNKQYSMYTRWKGDRTLVKFVPDEHFETTETSVNYPIPGADVVQQTQILGSLLGTNTISSATFRELHPYIADPDAEKFRVHTEEFERATQAALINQLGQGQLPLPVASIIAKHLARGRSIFEAIELADKEIREKQATEAPPPPEGMAMPPEAMAGMAAGPAAMQQPVPEPAPQIEVPGDVERMRQLMSAMAGR